MATDNSPRTPAVRPSDRGPIPIRRWLGRRSMLVGGAISDLAHWLDNGVLPSHLTAGQPEADREAG